MTPLQCLQKQSVSLGGQAGVELRHGQTRQTRIVLCGGGGHPRGGSLGDARTRDSLQGGHDGVADAVAGAIASQVGGVGDVVQRKLGTGGQNLPPCPGQQRTADGTGHAVGGRSPFTASGDSPHAAGTAAPQKPLQYGLQIVVGVVGGQKDLDMLLCHAPCEEIIPRFACGGLHALPRRLGQSGNIRPLADKLHPKGCADRAAKGLVTVSLLPPYAVVEVQGDNPLPTVLAEPLQKGADGQLQKKP